MSDLNHFESIVDENLKMNAYLFSIFSISGKIFINFQNICVFIFKYKNKKF